MPENPKLYDKMRPPKKEGQATTVYFHVTVMGLDSIDETSMVILEYLYMCMNINYLKPPRVLKSSSFKCD